MKRNKCIVVLCCSKYYQNHLAKIHTMLKMYADKCNADLYIQKDPPDKSFKRNLMSQKLLIPKLYVRYEHVVMLDLDIFIPDTSNDIFDSVISDGVGFSAVTNPIMSEEFKYVCKNIWRKLPENSDQHNPYTGEVSIYNEGINGGVMYFKTSEMANLMFEFYNNNESEWSKNTVLMNNEETPYWWITKEKGIFFKMDKSYNYQMLYHLSGQYKDVIKTYLGIRGKLYRRTYQILPCFLVNNVLGKKYRESVFDASKNNIIHFAGNLPYPYFALK
jgi:hypothetical protein